MSDRFDYETPAVRDLGRLEDITRGAKNGMNEGGGTPPNIKT